MVAISSIDIPVAHNGWVEPLDPFDTVSGTNHEAGSAVPSYLLGLGHRSIAYVHGTPGYRGRIERYYGVHEALETRPEVTLKEVKFQTEMRFSPSICRKCRPEALPRRHSSVRMTAWR
ncbi:MAG: hypothetical protein MO852_00480 [Candidatus Devosia euplotis]|nr:hypothetical protein [Candidatus Devosia euplotis]